MIAAHEVILVLGGTRSGKSAVAERLAAAAAASVTYVATAPPGDGSDPSWEARVAAHRARRPPEWSTVELGAGADLATALLGVGGVALVDSLSVWLAGCPGFAAPAGSLCQSLRARAASGRPTVVVSDEVGLGVHPASAVGVRFADALGELNRAVADAADRVLLVVAGRVLDLPAAVKPSAAPGRAPGGRP